MDCKAAAADRPVRWLGADGRGWFRDTTGSLDSVAMENNKNRGRGDTVSLWMSSEVKVGWSVRAKDAFVGVTGWRRHWFGVDVVGCGSWAR